MRNKKLIAPLAVALLIGASYVLGWSTLFTVSSVEIKGTNAFLPMKVQVGEKLARVEPRAVEATYERFDFIQDAKVSRNWITGKVTIGITPRTPIAMYNDQAIDALGKAFVVPGKFETLLPKIQATDIKGALIAANFFNSLPDEIKAGLLLLKVGSYGGYVLEVNIAGRNIELLWGLPIENTLKAKVLKALLAQPENLSVKKIDLSAPHAPLVK
jgi:hypothetical protein